MFRLEDNLWWYVGMRRIAYNLLSRHLNDNAGPLRVLDAGCGTGGSLRLLERFGRVTAFDFARMAAEMYLTRQRGRILVASTDAIPFADESFDLVTSFDVICQLPFPGDEAALRELGRVLRPGGILFVRTPAYQSLYGPHDVTLHTHHRYSTTEMAKKMERSGLQVVETTYANTFLLPVAVARRMWAKFRGKAAGESDVRPVPKPLNTALTGILGAEAMLVEHTRLPFGLSVIALARKP
jgi:SAM-dependent methyltransferase